MNEEKTLKRIVFLDPLPFRKRQKIKVRLVTSQCPKFKNEEKYDILNFLNRKNGKSSTTMSPSPPFTRNPMKFLLKKLWF
jgi:hypothetical protein